VIADIEALVAGSEDGPFRRPGDELRERLRRRIERGASLESEGFLSLAVEGDGRLIGDIQARAPKYAFPPGVCEIGITLLPDVRGKGFGREAVAQFTELLFSEKAMERVQASTALDNMAMRRVLELVGYRYEGVLRSYAPGGAGAREDYVMYAVVRPDWAR
jgi:RimJ/RimL family protein N-acetyltransferase